MNKSSFLRSRSRLPLALPLAAALMVGNAWAQHEQEVQHHAERSQAVEVEAERQMHEAHRLMQEAMQHYADVSKEASEARAYAYRFLTEPRRAMIGVIINSRVVDGKNQGVSISAVTPGGPAEQAGLRSGDVLIAVNGHPLDDPGDLGSPQFLREVMGDLEAGDEVHFEFLRESRRDAVTVIAERRAPTTLAPVAPMVISGNTTLDLSMDGLPEVIQINKALQLAFHGHFWEQLELVNLNPQLGRYFGADEGLLVINVPEDFEFDIQGGDVVKGINGRMPKDPSHAFRILRSYEQGEVIALDLLRDGGDLSVEIEVPERKDIGAWSWVDEDHELRRLNIPLDENFVNGYHFEFSQDTEGDTTVIELRSSTSDEDDQL